MRRASIVARWPMIGLAAVILTLVVAAGADGDGGSAGEQAAGAGAEGTPCAVGGSCTFVNSLASPGATGADPKPVSFADAAALAKPASACPDVAHDYASVGIQVDGFIGPCPRIFDAKR